MNDRPENLLDDVLMEATPADFRSAVLGQTLRLARRRRHWRQTRRVAALLATLALCGIFVWREIRPLVVQAPVSATKAVGESYTLVTTQPLPFGEIVTTHPLISNKLVASAAAVEVVQTGSGNYRVINDDELLALVGSHPAGLIRTGPNTEQLIFADPKDQKGFPLN